MAYCAVLMHRIIMKVYEVESHFLRYVYKSYGNLVLLDLDLSKFLVMIFIGKMLLNGLIPDAWDCE